MTVLGYHIMKFKVHDDSHCMARERNVYMESVLYKYLYPKQNQ